MNILLISRGVPTKHDPQWGSFEYDQAKALATHGHKVIVASVDSRFRLYSRKLGLTYEEHEGVKLYNYFLCPAVITGFLGNAFKNKVIEWQWQQIIKAISKNDDKIDVIYSHYLFNTYYAVHFLSKLNAPIVAIEHWSELQKETLTPYVMSMTEAYNHISKVIAVSQSLKKTLKQKFNIDAQVVYNMVGDEFTYTPHSISSPTVRFIAAGSLIHRKGYDLLIQAFSQTHLPKDQWELRIIGSGIERNNLLQLIEKAGLQDNITLVGQKTKQDIVNLYQQSDVFVLPSRSETFGVVYIEAMACGLPVIATPCGGPEEFVTKKNGLLVPVDNVEALADAIKYMYDHHQEYDRQAIANDCQARFSSEVIAKQLTEIFEYVINKRGQ